MRKAFTASRLIRKSALTAVRLFGANAPRSWAESLNTHMSKQTFNSTRSVARTNGNYKVNISFDENSRGTVEIAQDHDTTEWSNKSIIQNTVVNLRQNDSK